MHYLTVIIISFFIIMFLTYGDIWLFELKKSYFLVLCFKVLKLYLIRNLIEISKIPKPKPPKN